MTKTRNRVMSALVFATIVIGSVAAAAPAQAASKIYYSNARFQLSDCQKDQRKKAADRAYKIVHPCRFGQPWEQLIDGYYFAYKAAY